LPGGSCRIRRGYGPLQTWRIVHTVRTSGKKGLAETRKGLHRRVAFAPRTEVGGERFFRGGPASPIRTDGTSVPRWTSTAVVRCRSATGYPGRMSPIRRDPSAHRPVRVGPECRRDVDAEPYGSTMSAPDRRPVRAGASLRIRVRLGRRGGRARGKARELHCGHPRNPEASTRGFRTVRRRATMGVGRGPRG